jgi:hypothetical protein
MATVNRKPPALATRVAPIDAYLGTRPASTQRRQLPPTGLPTIAVYDGLLLVGQVVATARCRYDVHDAASHIIGTYPSACGAAGELQQRARR